jgi:acylphosphatase
MFAWDEARRRGLLGGVRNLRDGRVEVEVEGARAAVEALIESLRKGPPMARVIDLDVQWESPAGQYVDFRIWH